MPKNKAFEKLFVIRGDSFHEDYSSYLVGKEKEGVRKAFRERKWTAGQLQPQYRVINHWDELGLLPEASRAEEGQWRKFTYIETVWIRVIARLRDMGLPLLTIAEIKKCVMEWDSKLEAYPLFEYFFLKAIINDADHYIAYFPDGRAGLISARELELMKVLTPPQDVLLISLKSVAISMGHDVSPQTPAVIPTEGETEVLLQARTGLTREIKASLRAGRVEEVEHTKVYPDETHLREITQGMRGNDSYGEITRVLEGGTPQGLKVTKKKRFK